MELSLCMIVKDEAERLANCLESVRHAVDEVVILDTGSGDETKRVARRYTDRVYDYVWQDDFAAARNASFAYATCPFILWLDADDVLDAEEAEKLCALKAKLNETVDAVMMPYHYAFDAAGRPTLVFERERIVRRAAGFVFSGVVHEAMAVRGNVLHEPIAVRHTGTHGVQSNRRNLAIYEKWLSRGRALSARDWYYYARELKIAGEWEKAEAAFSSFLGMDGWAVNRADAFVLRGECLMQLGRGNEAKRSILASLAEGMPRAEALCALGACFAQEKEWETAAHWYRAALLCTQPQTGGAFTNPDAYGYLPLMQLCVLLARMGRETEAAKMNEQALLLRPGDPAALAKRDYFAARLAGGLPEADA